MRTRLDEIVEEESRAGGYGTWSPHGAPDTVGGTARRIAERAFRHGCEMGGMAAVSHCEQIRLGKAPMFGGYEVQPAPAEEKCGDCGHTKHWAECPVCASRRLDPFCKDRRKGERRKHYEVLALEFYTIGERPHGDTALAYFRNHRSGKDRRKK